MIHAEICCDIASIAIEAGDTLFTWTNDIESDGGFNVHIYQSREDIATLEDAELMNNRSNAFFTKLIVGPRQARICWSDCYDPYAKQQNKILYEDRGMNPYAATLPQGRYDVFRWDGDWHFVREGDLDLPKLKQVKVETTMFGKPYTSTEWVPE